MTIDIAEKDSHHIELPSERLGLHPKNGRPELRLTIRMPFAEHLQAPVFLGFHHNMLPEDGPRRGKTCVKSGPGFGIRIISIFITI